MKHAAQSRFRSSGLLRSLWLGLLLFSGQALAAQPADETQRLLAALTNAHGVPGFEDSVRDILKKEWGPLLGDLHTDGIGNLLGTLKGKADSPRVLLMAHMDEVGFLVRHIDDNGFIYFHNLGGHFAQSVLSQRLSILTANGPVYGYTGMKSDHILRPEERERMVPLAAMVIDIGVRSRAEAEQMGIRPGLPITYDSEFRELNGTGRYLAKAWDDRVGLAVITQAVRRLKGRPHPNNVQVVATVQEEVGLRGASVVTEATQPDIVINVELGVAGDFPLLTSPTLSQSRLGGGPSIYVFDGSMIPNNKYVEWIIRLAKDAGIAIQFDSVSGLGQDAAKIQTQARGVIAVTIGVPTRYAHSASGVIDRADYDRTVDLVVAMIENLSESAVTSIGKF